MEAGITRPVVGCGVGLKKSTKRLGGNPARQAADSMSIFSVEEGGRSEAAEAYRDHVCCFRLLTLRYLSRS